MVVARIEDSGVSGVFPVTGISQRQATDMLWLTLERGDGSTSRMGVTTAHPLFTVGEGWITAGELVPGDAIRDSDLKELTVLAVEIDSTPQFSYNLEIADAHTYFAGELEVWGHNAPYHKYKDLLWTQCGGKCPSCGIQMVFSGPRTGPRRNRLSIDHILPRKYGGGDELGNLRPMCCSCNSKRGAPRPPENY